MNAALDAAITTVPRLLMAACTMMLAKANTALWMPAGRPIWTILAKLARSKCRAWALTRMVISVWVRQ